MTDQNTTPLSPYDFEFYNRLAEEMEYYHSMLRSSWNTVYNGTAPGSKKPSPSQLISSGIHFCRHLEGHHNIEETIWHPVLGKKMHAWRPGGFATQQHKEMHAGLDIMLPYLEACRKGEKELRREELRRIMDGFGALLWRHLDEEVQELGAENMRRFWSKEEVPFLVLCQLGFCRLGWKLGGDFRRFRRLCLVLLFFLSVFYCIEHRWDWPAFWKVTLCTAIFKNRVFRGIEK